MSDYEQQILDTLKDNEEIVDSGEWAKQKGVEHSEIDGALKSLTSLSMIDLKVIEHKKLVLLADGESALKDGTPEFRVFNALPAEGGISKKELDEKVGALIAKLGQGEAMRLKWIRADKVAIYRNAEKVEDTVRNVIQALQKNEAVSDDDIKMLTRRRMAQITVTKTYKVTKGPKYSTTIKKEATELTSAMLVGESWKNETFKAFNFDAQGAVPQGGHLHPLMKVRSEIREIFIGMGFEEMPTNNYVESSFWNFDSLFQPQQHPARDAHDTFFLKDPATAASLPADYLEKVKEMHSNGGFGSIGYRYDWKVEEAQKTVSSRMLYKLANGPEGFKPAKYFSIDRVFRNETLDATHLAEFHQIEGLVADYDITLANLIGVINQFFLKLGIENIRFKPAYNPYTEPSMEIFGYHPILKRWVELEMLRPMGLPENVRVIAWGLSLERPTMIKYNIASIRDIFGPLIDLNFVKNNPIAFIDSKV